MSYAAHRSCVADLHLGMADGTYKQYAMNRGGVVEDTTLRVRETMCGTWHGFNEAPAMHLPDAHSQDKFPAYPRYKEVSCLENV